MKAPSFLHFLSVALVGSIHAAAQETLRHRKLSLDKIAGYEPDTIVTDYNAIDLDLQFIENQLNGNDESVIANAIQVYLRGGSVASLATLKVDSPLGKTVPAGTPVAGRSNDSRSVSGTVYQNTNAGSTTLQVLYKPGSDQSNYLRCRVGGLTSFNQQDVTLCYAASGSVAVDGAGTLAYSYDQLSDNTNLVTLSSLSKDRTLSEVVLYPTLRKYQSYYLTVQYANEWVNAAMQKGITNELQRGRADFGQASFNARTLAATTGMVVLNIWGEVTRLMEDALRVCNNGRNDVVAWDRMVALYSGSKEGIDGSSQGKLLHQLADDMCKEFSTCGDNSDQRTGTSFVNQEIISSAQQGKGFIKKRECNDANVHRQNIEAMMTVPLIQGVLKATYERSVGPDTDTLNAASATFAAALLPLVYSCSQSDAKTLTRHTHMGSTNVDFSAVKTVLEKNYDCLQVSCASVGGLIDPATGIWFSGATPCRNEDITQRPQPFTPAPTPLRRAPTPTRAADVTASPAFVRDTNNNNQTAIIAGSVSGVVLFIIVVLIFLFCMVRRNKEADPAAKGNAPEFKEGTKDGSSELI